VGTALASRENSVVHALLKVRRIFKTLPEENQTSAGAAKGLVSEIVLLK
jgi:hypothetical protein